MHIGIVLPSVPGYSETFFRSKISGLLENNFQVTLFVKNKQKGQTFICPIVQHPMLHSNSVLRLLQTISIFLKVFMIAPASTKKLWDSAKQNGFTISARIKAIVIASAILPYKLNWLHFGFATPALERELIGKAIGAKVAVSFRGFDINQLPLQDKKIYNMLWKNIDKIHSISKYLIKKANDIGLESKIPYKVITPALDASRFTILETKAKKNTILLVSRLHWIKGIEEIFTAISILNQKGISLSITIAGDGEEKERLLFAAHQLGISNNVSFLGAVKHDDVIQEMNEHELFIQYSHQEGFCNAALEAQATGMLCIVSDAEGLQENILHDKTGWVVPKRNPELLAEKIEYVLNLSDSVKDMIRTNARKRVEEDFNLEKQKQAFVDFYTLS